MVRARKHRQPKSAIRMCRVPLSGAVAMVDANPQVPKPGLLWPGLAEIDRRSAVLGWESAEGVLTFAAAGGPERQPHAQIA